jgi:hypothetical protein
LYFIYGILTFWWVQRPIGIPLHALLLALLTGDIAFIALLMYAGGSGGGPFWILLFPQLAVSGWLLRSQMALSMLLSPARC